MLIANLATNLPAAQGPDLTPAHLRCEYEEQPLAVDTRRPRLSWELESARRAQVQSAYQVLVASSETLLRAYRGDLWDSGKVPSSDQNQIEYGGKPLASNQDCFWKVRAWDGGDTVGDWSRPTRWSMGLLEASDWKARWIAAPPDTNGLPVFRKTFRVAKPLRQARVHVCGLGQYDLFLDGGKVGNHFLDPAWSVYEKTVFYNTFDLTSELRRGPHTLGVMLGKGFYNTTGDRRVHGVNARRPLKFILQAHLRYADGTEETLLSDNSWRATAGPITHSAILGGEDYDARRLPAGWGRPGFNDSAWVQALETIGSGGALRAALSPPLQTFDNFRPVTIDEPQPGVFVYDFGQNASSIPRLRVRGSAGQTLRMVPAEQRHGMSSRRNDGKGPVNPAGVGNPNYFRYTLRGGAEEAWTPQFSYTGFQYLQVEGAVPKGRPNSRGLPVVEELVSVHVRNAADAVGSFECSIPLFNRVDKIIDWAVRANLSHVLTDCPHREKLGWLEVAYLMGPSIAGRYDIARFYGKVAWDIADSQQPDGLVPTVAPAYPAFAGGFAYTPEWGAAAVVIPWMLYEWYGDRSVLAERFDTMKSFVDYMRATSTNLVPRPGLGDWYDYGHGKPAGASQFTPVELTAMATFHRCARIVADTAQVLNRPEDQRRYQELADAIARAFNARYFDGKSEYRNSGSPQTANSMALVTGIVPKANQQAVLNRLVEDLVARGYQQTAGDIGYCYLLQALGRNGRHDVICNMTTRTNLGSYGFIVGNGWTSMPEAWDANTGASMNHCMLGHIQDWFLGHVAGIRPDPDAPGFRRFIVAPQPVGDLTWARGSLHSIRGPIACEWDLTKNRLRVKLTVPPNTAATLLLPTDNAVRITEKGWSLASAQGVKALGTQGGIVALDVASGRYEFECPPSPQRLRP
jgi:alpha-L-rhamnosidase